MGEYDLGSIPVTTDPDEHARLLAEWHRIADIAKFQVLVAASGHQPPDHRPGWMAVLDHGSDGDADLVWARRTDAAEAAAIPGYATLPDGSHIHMGDLPGV